jgi:hypothetical protein
LELGRRRQPEQVRRPAFAKQTDLPPAENGSTPGRNLIFSAIKISRQLGVFLSREAIANGKIAFYSL